MKTLLVAAYRTDIHAHLRLAQEYECGLEIQAFSHPNVLENHWRDLLDDYKKQLIGFPGPLACHGAFFDMSVASEDPRVVELTRSRYMQNLDIAAELGAQHLVFHTNFLPMIRTSLYRKQYIERQISFWNEMGYEAAKRGVWVALENMWDPDPMILKMVLSGISAPNIGICLDISHAYLYNRAHPLNQWVEALSEYIIHTHMNNTRGVIDEHLALNVAGGAINFTQLLPQMANLPQKPWMVLELDDLKELLQSLKFVSRLLK